MTDDSHKLNRTDEEDLRIILKSSMLSCLVCLIDVQSFSDVLLIRGASLL